MVESVARQGLRRGQRQLPFGCFAKLCQPTVRCDRAKGDGGEPGFGEDVPGGQRLARGVCDHRHLANERSRCAASIRLRRSRTGPVGANDHGAGDVKARLDWAQPWCPGLANDFSTIAMSERWRGVVGAEPAPSSAAGVRSACEHQRKSISTQRRVQNFLPRWHQKLL